MADIDGQMPQGHKAIIGSPDSFWSYSSTTGFDLSHPPKPSSSPIYPTFTIKTTTCPITIDPAKSALVVIDFQNFFLSPALGRSKGAGHDALHQVVENAVPACRKAGVRIIWLNWGLTEKEVEEMPPGVKRAFGFSAVVHRDRGDNKGLKRCQEQGRGLGVDRHGVSRDAGAQKMHKGLGSDIGEVQDPATGEKVQAGGLLMRGSWNAGLYPPLDEMCEEGRQLERRPDVLIHKNRMSGMWGAGTDLEVFLEKQGLRTLFFSGVNTDQCVGGTLTDCFSKGYDCVLLSDGAGTTSPEYAQRCFEFNAANTWGFLTTCRALREGVDKGTPEVGSLADRTGVATHNDEASALGARHDAPHKCSTNALRL